MGLIVTKRLFAAVAALGLIGAAPPPATPKVQLWRIDCGSLPDTDLAPFADTMALDGQRRTLTVPCYLIRHGRDLMIWDTGLPRRYLGKPAVPPDNATLPQGIEAALARLRLKPADIGRVGISHYHFDHSGQLGMFPKATLLIGAGDWAAITGAAGGVPGLERALFAPRTSGTAKVDSVSGDRDIFGDGSVVMLDLPGHTPGHHGLLVRLARMGPVLLTGDLAHTVENYRDDNVPTFNTNRADTLASFDRFKKIAATLHATVVIEHVAADIPKLPAFPTAAE